MKGAYNPVPSTRSKELRDLIGRIFTLNWEKRPSINEILATPIVKARITKFLSATIRVSTESELLGSSGSSSFAASSMFSALLADVESQMLILGRTYGAAQQPRDPRSMACVPVPNK